MITAEQQVKIIRNICMLSSDPTETVSYEVAGIEGLKDRGWNCFELIFRRGEWTIEVGAYDYSLGKYVKDGVEGTGKSITEAIKDALIQELVCPREDDI